MTHTPDPAETAVWATYSLAERDRRWAAVRLQAREAGLDGVLVPLGNGVDGRYLTQLNVAAVALATDGQEPIVITELSRDRAAYNPWVPAPRHAGRGAWGRMMAEALIELGLERARIGVAGLRGGRYALTDTPDGAVNFTSMAEVRVRLPRAHFANGTDLLGLARYRKSPEELESLAQASAAAERGIAQLANQAREGISLTSQCAAVTQTLLGQGSEYRPVLFRSHRGKGPAHPSTDALMLGDVLDAEVSAVIGGQTAIEEQAFSVGPLPRSWLSAVAYHRELFEAGLDLIRVGMTLQDLRDSLRQRMGRRRFGAEIELLGTGMALDGPRLNRNVTPGVARSITIENDTAWIWKPRVRMVPGGPGLGWGGVVAVNRDGCRQVASRAHGLVVEVQ